MKRPDDVAGYVKPWREYADWLEAQNKELRKMIDDYDVLQVRSNDLISKQKEKIAKDREATRAVTDRHSKLVTMGELSYTEYESEELEALAKRLEE